MDVRLVAGRYRLNRELGRGGMGTVWLGEDKLTGRRVAVKELRPPHGLSGTDQETFARRALHEARSAAHIQHPNAVTLFDVIPATAADDAVYLIMEHIDGQSLAEVISDYGGLSDGRARAIGLQLLSILETAHGLGIVHRDIKPANIMITVSGQVKLTDFGIAYSLGETRLTRSGVIGTQAYTAPEMFESAPITPAVDLWSLGATLYHAVEGRGPFDRDTTAATLRAILIEDLPVPSCAPDLATAIGGLLTRNPAQRMSITQARAVLLGGPRDHLDTITAATCSDPVQASPSTASPTPAPRPPLAHGGGDPAITSSFGPSATALQREHKAVITSVTGAAPPAERFPLGIRRLTAAALLGLSAVLGIAGLFLPEYSRRLLITDSEWLWPQLLYLGGWVSVTSWMLTARTRLRTGALFGIGLGVPAIGLALQQLANITLTGYTPRSGFAVSLAGVLTGTAGTIYALTIPDNDIPAPATTVDAGPAVAAWRKALPPTAALAATVWYPAFPWAEGSNSLFSYFGRSSWEGLGVILPILVFAAITFASVRSRTAQDRAALLTGAAVYLLAIGLQDIVRVIMSSFKENPTFFFWLYCVLVATVVFSCARLARSPRNAAS